MCDIIRPRRDVVSFDYKLWTRYAPPTSVKARGEERSCSRHELKQHKPLPNSCGAVLTLAAPHIGGLSGLLHAVVESPPQTSVLEHTRGPDGPGFTSQGEQKSASDRNPQIIPAANRWGAGISTACNNLAAPHPPPVLVPFYRLGEVR